MTMKNNMTERNDNVCNQYGEITIIIITIIFVIKSIINDNDGDGRLMKLSDVNEAVVVVTLLMIKTCQW